MDERSRLSRRARACRHADNGRLSLDRRGERSRPLRRPDVPAARAKGTPNTAPAVLGVVAAPDGSVWARLRGTALLRYQHEAFENILAALGSPESVVTAMERGRDNSILAATLGRGAMISRNGRVDAIVDTNALPGSSFVISIAADAERRVLARHARRRRRSASRAPHVTRFTDGLPGPEGEQPARAGRRHVWIGTDKGVVRWTGTEISRSGIPDGADEIFRRWR